MMGGIVGEESLEQFGGVLAAPVRRRRCRLVAGAALAAALVAAVALAVADHHSSAISRLGTVADPDNVGVPALAFSPDGKTLITGDVNGNAYFWNVVTLHRTATAAQSSFEGTAIALSRTGTVLGLCGAEHNPRRPPASRRPAGARRRQPVVMGLVESLALLPAAYTMAVDAVDQPGWHAGPRSAPPENKRALCAPVTFTGMPALTTGSSPQMSHGAVQVLSAHPAWASRCDGQA
jgi:hypothetical protein